MARHTLYAYVDGADLADCVEPIEEALSEFVAVHTWVASQPCVVNQRYSPAPSDQPDDLPGWDLGLNLELPDVGSEPVGWFDDVAAIAAFVGELAAETGRQFALGVHDAETGISEDLFEVSGPNPDHSAFVLRR